MEAEKFATCNENKVNIPTQKVVLTLFFYVFGPILVEWMPKGTTINAAPYSDTLMKFHININICWKRRLSTGIVLFHDDTRPHIAGVAQSMLMILKSEILVHPVYILDLSLFDYEIFHLLKTFLEGKHFSTDEEVNKAVKE